MERVGPFEVLRELGRGGMGVVYLARDTRLDREVAIKALPEHLASDPARLERFEREARTLAGLSHPNVAGIYGVEEQDNAKYLVLEFVDGETLADRLDRGPMPIDESVELAVQIAAGVEAAHDAGVIHRDLKPANIKITPDGVAKVLDFGLARTEEGASSSGGLDSPTMTAPQPQHSPTIEGAILGTAAYMSPEQARGRRIDKRTDVWSFGVVLYEMLTGTSPFHGETATDSIGAVLHKNLSLDQLPPDTPPHVRGVLERCLERDRSLRYRDIGDIRIELLRPRAEPGHAVSTPTARRSPPRVAGVTAAVLLAIASAIVTWFAATRTRAEPGHPVRKINIVSEDLRGGLQGSSPVVSPDGERVAYLRDDQVYIRDLASFEPVAVPGTEGAKTVFWSPSSRHLGFTTESGIYKLMNLGGGATRVSDLEVHFSPVWTDHGMIVASVSGEGRQKIVAIPDHGGAPVPLIERDADTTIDFHNVATIPGTGILVFVQHFIEGNTPVMASDGERTVELVDFDDTYLTRCAWSPTGHVLFTRGFGQTDVWALPFSPERMESTGEPFLVLPEANFPSVSSDGTLVVLRGSTGESGELVWITQEGHVEPITDAGEIVQAPIVSPDGRRIAFASGSSPSNSDVWVHDLERGFNGRISLLETFVAPVAWSPDGTEIAVLTFTPSDEVAVKTHFFAADGSGETRDPVDAMIVSLDDEWTYAVVGTEPRLPDSVLKSMSMENQSVMGVVVEDRRLLPFGAALSPDGSLLVYVSSKSGQQEVYCTRFPEGSGRWQVSTDGGMFPKWSPDGTRVYFQSDGQYYTVEISREPEIGLSRPTPIFPESSVDLEDFAQLVPSPSGDRFVTVRMSDTAAAEDSLHISIIENWFEEFRGSDRP